MWLEESDTRRRADRICEIIAVDDWVCPAGEGYNVALEEATSVRIRIGVWI